MKIVSVRIENFRSIEDATIPLNDYACLVGPNGAGKSTILTALNVFLIFVAYYLLKVARELHQRSAIDLRPRGSGHAQLFDATFDLDAVSLVNATCDSD